MTQLDMFETAYIKGKEELKTVDYSIGIYHEIAHIKGVNDLSENALTLLHYLYLNHSRPEDGFVHADLVAGLLGYYDTREVRKITTEIDMKTELVIYASQKGYKLASNDNEIEEAIKFALAPAMTSIKRVYAKNKRASNIWLHGFLGNLEKEFGGVTNGQQQIDDDLNQRTVNHYPKTPFREYVPEVKERIENYKHKYLNKR